MPRSQSPRISILEKFFFLSCSFSSFVHKIVINGLQPPAKMQYSVMLAREQSVDADSRFRGKLLETDPLDFVRDENVALLFREFVERCFKLFEQDASRIGGLRASVRRWKQFFE